MKLRQLLHHGLFACAVIGFAGLFGAAVCGTPIGEEGCSNDNDCNPDGGSSWSCDVPTGTCLCNNDSACDAATEFCNPQGFCQERSGCFHNGDCESPLFCDVTTGECLDPRSPSKNCSLDTHCPFLYYCNGAACVPGCQGSGDCPLGYGCLLNTCVEGGCTDRSDCEYGERCISNSCQRGLDSLTCQDCSGMGGRLACDGGGTDPSHTCLINDTYEAGDPHTEPAEYCTSSCNNDEDCPWGFSCSAIIGIPPEWRCNRGDTCFNGTECVVGSESTQGFCMCTSNADCQQYFIADVCENGGCVVGRACGLFPNLQCADVGVIP